MSASGRSCRRCGIQLDGIAHIRYEKLFAISVSDGCNNNNKNNNNNDNNNTKDSHNVVVVRILGLLTHVSLSDSRPAKVNEEARFDQSMSTMRFSRLYGLSLQWVRFM